MALTIDADNEFGFTSSSAYAKIERFSGNSETIELDVTLYADAAARMNGKRPFTRKKLIIPYPNVGVPDILGYCYEQLKLHPEFYSASNN